MLNKFWNQRNISQQNADQYKPKVKITFTGEKLKAFL